MEQLTEETFYYTNHNYSTKQMRLSSTEKAYQYADDPYKELISLGLVRDRLFLDSLNTCFFNNS